MTGWTLWFYRENIGWWLEDRGLENPQAVSRAVMRVLREHSNDDMDKYAYMIVRDGQSPTKYAGKVFP